MTTTSVYQGMDTDGKPTSRVLRPPGGGSSNIFGHYEEEAPAPQRAQRNQDAAAPQSAAKEVAASAPQDTGRQQNQQKIAYNPITGMPYDTPKAKPAEEKETEEEKKEEANGDAAANGNAAPEKSAEPAKAGGPQEQVQFQSTRVTQPPGGRSTKLW